jgi:PAS domain S-box-containing protein
MMGYQKDEVIGKSMFDFISDDSKEPAMKNMRRRLAGEPVESYEVKAFTKSRDIKYFLVSAAVIPYEKDNAFLAVLSDITERKRFEHALRESQEKYRVLFNGITEAVYVHEVFPEQPGRFIAVNDAACSMLGYTENELLQLTVKDIDIPEQEGKIPLIQEKLFRDGHVLFETCHVTKDGRRIPVEINIRLFELMGTPVVLSVARDITERKLAEEKLRASEKELKANYIIQTALNEILNKALENITVEEYLQKSLETVVAVPWLSVESTGSIYLVEDETEILVLKAQYNISEQISKSCSYIPFGKCLCGKVARTGEILFARHTDEEHEICHEGMAAHGHYIVPILFDRKTIGIINIYLGEGHVRRQIDEMFLSAVADTLAGVIMRKRAEALQEKLYAQLMQAQKMEAVGLLAGGVAHDFNNVLTAIRGLGYILKMKMKEDEPLKIYPEKIIVSAEKAINLSQSLLAFSRKQIIFSRPVNINHIITEVSKLFNRVIGEDIELKLVLRGEDIIVMADPNQMEQVLMNLATNGRDAMPDGGLLTIKTETVEIDQKFIKENGFGTEGKYALISVTDTGSGIKKAIMDKIFDPFFTTKEEGKGTGLGLSIVYGIIKQHNGDIRVYSEPGEGTTFKMYLPITEVKERETNHEDIISARKGMETILLAEDDSEVRLFMKEILQTSGYRIIEAVDGNEAIEKFMNNMGRIQLLLFDVIMPKKNGRETYEKIRTIAPQIKVIFLSGYPEDVIASKGITGEGFDFVLKTVHPNLILKKIREVLDE